MYQPTVSDERPYICHCWLSPNINYLVLQDNPNVKPLQLKLHFFRYACVRTMVPVPGTHSATYVLGLALKTEVRDVMTLGSTFEGRRLHLSVLRWQALDGHTAHWVPTDLNPSSSFYHLCRGENHFNHLKSLNAVHWKSMGFQQPMSAIIDAHKSQHMPFQRSTFNDSLCNTPSSSSRRPMSLQLSNPAKTLKRKLVHHFQSTTPVPSPGELAGPTKSKRPPPPTLNDLLLIPGSQPQTPASGPNTPVISFPGEN